MFYCLLFGNHRPLHHWHSGETDRGSFPALYQAPRSRQLRRHCFPSSARPTVGRPLCILPLWVRMPTSLAIKPGAAASNMPMYYKWIISLWLMEIPPWIWFTYPPKRVCRISASTSPKRVYAFSFSAHWCIRLSLCISDQPFQTLCGGLM